MNPAAFLFLGIEFDWCAVFIVLAVLAGGLLMFSLALARGRPLMPLFILLPCAVLFSLVFGRAVHWFTHPLQYDSFLSAMTGFRAGGFSLPGAFLGTALSALLVALTGLEEPGELADILAPAGALSLFLGRIGSLFDTSDRGFFLPDSPLLADLPFSAPSLTSSGTVEWRFATFAFQSGLCLFLLILLLVLFFRVKRHDGRLCAIFLSLYSSAEIVLDSTRYDAGYLPFNGFISLVQICCLALLTGLCVYYSVRSVKKHGLQSYHWLFWLLALASSGLGGYMEYFVQRHGNLYAIAYTVMGFSFLLFSLVNLLLIYDSGDPNHSKNSKETSHEKAQTPSAESQAG